MNAHVNDNELQASLARGLADATSADVAAGVGLQAARHAAQSARRLGRVQDGLRASAWACIHLTRLGQHAQMQEEAQPLLPLLAAEQEPGLLLLRRELLRCLTLSGAETVPWTPHTNWPRPAMPAAAPKRRSPRPMRWRCAWNAWATPGRRSAHSMKPWRVRQVLKRHAN
jgi:hypothetical protein